MLYKDYPYEVSVAWYYSELFRTKIIPEVPVEQYSITSDLKEFITTVNAADLIISDPYNIALGNTVRDDDVTVITIAAILEEEERRPQLPFTLAEEFGHSVLKHPIDIDAEVSDDERRQYDRATHIFAGNLLLPITSLLEQVAVHKFHIMRIVAASGVPTKIVKYRFLNILERRFSLSEYYADRFLEEYLSANSTEEIENTTIFKLFWQYRFVLNEVKELEPYDYISHRAYLTPIADAYVKKIKDDRFRALSEELSNEA